MVAEVVKLLNSDIQEIITSPELSLSLLRCYSVMYINGASPRACEASQRMYFDKLKVDGMARAELMEKVKVRTCQPAWVGLKYSPIVMRHILPELLYDEIAIDYLKSGALKESDFDVLPDGYKANAGQENAPIKPTSEVIKKRGRKPQKSR